MIVYKSNALVEAAYRLSVHEQRILLACISQVRRDEPVTDEVLYSVSAADIAHMSGITLETTYSLLKDAALRLKRREVRLIEEPNGNGKKPSVMITGWVQTIIYREGEGRVELRFNKDMLPYLTELTRQFTKYALADVAKMDSAYGIRLYELLRQWGELGEREIEIEQLREWLALEDRYPAIKDLKKWVIEPAIAQINEHSPLTVTWDQRKNGRKVSHLIFTFAPKTTSKSKTSAKTKKNAIPKQPPLDLDKPRTVTEAELSRLAFPGEPRDTALRRLNAVVG
ncbi:RepB family plasmid replication initiator protein [Azotobacter chroococcum]|uniref:replication initiation protein n=1 Tax=Azotobacter chroococcum TaxID=353 RepID=UPI00103D0FEB|nr:replication initiation protein [Azotobacter chroococcum]TBW33667.1 RepB family plasmid replication initiator protein [Azotobacter chroococcum]